MANWGATKLVSVGPFHVTLKHEPLCVVAIAPELVPKAAWWVLRECNLDQRNGAAFNSLLLDDDGLSIVCSPLALSVLENLLQSNPSMVVSKQKWKAFLITVVGWELPGAVYYLADRLSQEGVSILHISTFDSEIFLVQEQDVARASSVFRRTENGLKERVPQTMTARGKNGGFKEGFELKVLPGNFFLTKVADGAALASCSAALSRLLLYDCRYSSLQKAYSTAETRSLQLRDEQLQAQTTSSSELQQPQTGNFVDGDGVSSPVGYNSPLSLSPAFSSGSTAAAAALRPSSVTMTGAAAEMGAGLNASEGATLDASLLLPPPPPHSQGRRAARPATFMCGLWQVDSELTLMLEEADLDAFPEGSLVVSPQRWKVIKLTGRAIEFDETGIVSAMTASSSGVGEMDAGVSLNISTATTNCTLCPEELLGQTLETLRSTLGVGSDEGGV